MNYTYAYYISTGVFERKTLWDFPRAMMEEGERFVHIVQESMFVRTDMGVFQFKDGEMSPETSSHWHKLADGEWVNGASAEFNLRYVVHG